MSQLTLEDLDRIDTTVTEIVTKYTTATATLRTILSMQIDLTPEIYREYVDVAERNIYETKEEVAVIKIEIEKLHTLAQTTLERTKKDLEVTLAQQGLPDIFSQIATKKTDTAQTVYDKLDVLIKKVTSTDITTETTKSIITTIDTTEEIQTYMDQMPKVGRGTGNEGQGEKWLHRFLGTNIFVPYHDLDQGLEKVLDSREYGVQYEKILQNHTTLVAKTSFIKYLGTTRTDKDIIGLLVIKYRLENTTIYDHLSDKNEITQQLEEKLGIKNQDISQKTEEIKKAATASSTEKSMEKPLANGSVHIMYCTKGINDQWEFYDEDNIKIANITRDVAMIGDFSEGKNTVHIVVSRVNVQEKNIYIETATSKKIKEKLNEHANTPEYDRNHGLIKPFEIKTLTNVDEYYEIPLQMDIKWTKDESYLLVHKNDVATMTENIHTIIEGINYIGTSTNGKTKNYYHKGAIQEEADKLPISIIVHSNLDRYITNKSNRPYIDIHISSNNNEDKVLIPADKINNYQHQSFFTNLIKIANFYDTMDWTSLRAVYMPQEIWNKLYEVEKSKLKFARSTDLGNGAPFAYDELKKGNKISLFLDTEMRWIYKYNHIGTLTASPLTIIVESEKAYNSGDINEFEIANIDLSTSTLKVKEITKKSIRPKVIEEERQITIKLADLNAARLEGGEKVFKDLYNGEPDNDRKQQFLVEEKERQDNIQKIYSILDNIDNEKVDLSTNGFIKEKSEWKAMYYKNFIYDLDIKDITTIFENVKEFPQKSPTMEYVQEKTITDKKLHSLFDGNTSPYKAGAKYGYSINDERWFIDLKNHGIIKRGAWEKNYRVKISDLYKQHSNEYNAIPHTGKTDPFITHMEGLYNSSCIAGKFNIATFYTKLGISDDE